MTALVAVVTIAAVAPVIIAEAIEPVVAVEATEAIVIVEATEPIIIVVEATEAVVIAEATEAIVIAEPAEPIIIAEAARPVEVTAGETRVIVAEIAHRTRAAVTIAITIVVVGARLAWHGNEAQRHNRNGNRHVSNVLRLHGVTLRLALQPTRTLRSNAHVTAHRHADALRFRPFATATTRPTSDSVEHE